MDKQDVLNALAKAKEAKQRKFKQTVDLIINFKDLDLKKPENHVELYIPLANRGRPQRLAAFVGPELKANAKAAVDTVIDIDEFDRYSKDKKAVKRLAAEHEFFIAQATIMTKVASAFGRVLGPRGKMPNPKAGCVVPPNANLTVLAERLRKTVKISVKKDPIFMTSIGAEDTDPSIIAENVMTIYKNIISHLPNEEQQIKSVYLKTTMGPAIPIVKAAAEEKKVKKAGKKKAEEPVEEKPAAVEAEA
ncbi:50S ribosomal protein L1 [Candidatus Woesearchaeota archaeon]|nr:50S ribosomal protein L1 [Candidatus Woesearchaeota archaeon]